MPKININGANIHYHEYGSGEETLEFHCSLVWPTFGHQSSNADLLGCGHRFTESHF